MPSDKVQIGQEGHEGPQGMVIVRKGDAFYLGPLCLHKTTTATLKLAPHVCTEGRSMYIRVP